MCQLRNIVYTRLWTAPPQVNSSYKRKAAQLPSPTIVPSRLFWADAQAALDISRLSSSGPLHKNGKKKEKKKEKKKLFRTAALSARAQSQSHDQIATKQFPGYHSLLHYVTPPTENRAAAPFRRPSVGCCIRHVCMYHTYVPCHT